MTFLASEKNRQAEFKLSSKYFTKEARKPGLFRNRLYPFALPVSCADQNLHQWIRTEAIEYFKKHEIVWHTSAGVDLPTNHMVSSQIMCLSIDLTSNGRRPLFVFHIVNGSRHHQEEFAHTLNAETRFFQWSYEARLKDHRERSTRGRSIVFFAFAAIASSAIRESVPRPIDVFVPENGFISLNVALSPGRLGSLSTKTTHPTYMQGIQSVWDRLEIRLQLQFPYRYQTKGEMLENCRDTDTLSRLLGYTISCGQYHIHKHTHCGVCIPCLVRRAAYRKVGWDDPTEYCKDLRVDKSDNIAVATSAWLILQVQGIRKVTAGSLSFAKGSEKRQLEQVVSRGLSEISDLLRAYGRL